MKNYKTVSATAKLLVLITTGNLLIIIGKLFEILAFVFGLSVILITAIASAAIIIVPDIVSVAIFPASFYIVLLAVMGAIAITLTFYITFIELLIVIFIIGVLAAIAMPNYCDYTVRARITEGMYLAAGAKERIGNVLTMEELKLSATSWNKQENGKGAVSKYVKSVLIDPNTGSITVTFNEKTVHSTFEYIPENSTLVFTPYLVQDGAKPRKLAKALADKHTNITDNIYWGCASTSYEAAIKRGLPNIRMGTLPAKHAPLECR